MSGTLGVSVSVGAVHALCLGSNGIAWAGSASYAEVPDLLEVVARLASECELKPRKARVVFERDVAQLRTLLPAPRLRARAARAYVRLEVSRLFRVNGTHTVTDAVVARLGRNTRALWIACVPEDIALAVVDGLRQAGIALDSLGPAADVLPHAIARRGTDGTLSIPNERSIELLSVRRGMTWRSRRVRQHDASEPEWAPRLARLGDRAAAFAAAYGAARSRPRLRLWPAEALESRLRVQKRRTVYVGLVAVALWIAAAGVHTGKLIHSVRESTNQLRAAALAVDSALTLQQDVSRTRAALAIISDAEAGRSQTLALLAAVTAALDDSTFLVSWRFSSDSALRIAGYSTNAAGVLAAVSGMPRMATPAFETPVVRQRLSGMEREWDRFAVVTDLRGVR